MNVDELLREQGERWRTPDVAEPDLGAALRRRARRLGVGLAAGVVVAALAVGGTVWATVPGNVPAVPGPAGTPSAVPPVASTTPSGVPHDTAGLIDLALTLAGDFESAGDQPPTAQVVESTLKAVTAASVLPEPEVNARPGTNVWVLQLEGTFRCDACSQPKGGTATRPVLRAMVRVDGLTVLGTATYDSPATLTGLGQVADLDLATASPGNLDAVERAIRHGLVGVDVASLTDVRAVRTTTWRAQVQLYGHQQLPPSYDSVWLVRLEGGFTCPACYRLGTADHGSVLVLVIGATTGELQTAVVSHGPVDIDVPARDSATWPPSTFR